MKQKINLLLAFLLALILFAGCAAPEQNETVSAPVSTEEEVSEPAVLSEEDVEEPTVKALEEENEAPTAEAEEPQERTITDLAGYEVTLPPAEKIERVVIIAPPLLATYAAVLKDTGKVVGANQSSFASMNPEILKMLVPNAEEISTTFLTGFTSNTEELLKLEPDVILVYGDFQKEGLASVTIPIVDFYIQNQQNEAWSVGIEELMREIFEIEDDNSLQAEWDAAKTKVEPILSSQTGEKKKGLMIMSNTGDKITVRGAGSYGDDWLLISGLSNAAGELQGDGLEVTMEQIYAWNPDVVYVFRGMPAASYLNNSIDGQDWSQVAAFKEGQVFDTPLGVMNWGAPCADSPLMLLWMVSKNFPEQLSEEEVNSTVKEYYSTRYSLTLTDDLVNSILNPYAE